MPSKFPLPMVYINCNRTFVTHSDGHPNVMSNMTMKTSKLTFRWWLASVYTARKSDVWLEERTEPWRSPCAAWLWRVPDQHLPCNPATAETEFQAQLKRFQTISVVWTAKRHERPNSANIPKSPGVYLPCTICCGSSRLPGSPLQPINSNIGML